MINRTALLAARAAIAFTRSALQQPPSRSLPWTAAITFASSPSDSRKGPHDPRPTSLRSPVQAGQGRRTSYSSKPVIAWDDYGKALVVDERTGRLVAANNDHTFIGLSEGEHPGVAAIPGGGWKARFKNSDGTTTADPLVAWIVRSNGSLTPVDTDVTGVADDATGVSNFDGLEPPAVQDPGEADHTL